MAASIVSCLIVSRAMACEVDLVFICAMDNGTTSGVAAGVAAAGVAAGVVAGVAAAAAFLAASIFFCKRVYTMVSEVVVCCPR